MESHVYASTTGSWNVYLTKENPFNENVQRIINYK